MFPSLSPVKLAFKRNLYFLSSAITPAIVNFALARSTEILFTSGAAKSCPAAKKL